MDGLSVSLCVENGGSSDIFHVCNGREGGRRPSRERGGPIEQPNSTPTQSHPPTLSPAHVIGKILRKPIVESAIQNNSINDSSEVYVVVL